MAINQGTIKIEGVFEIQSLLTFEMKVEPNKHGTASFTAILGESVNFHNVIQNVEGQNVKVLELDEKGNPKDRVIFAGVVKDCEVKTKGQYFWIAVNLISATYKLDNEIKSRSFQDGSMTYKKLIEKVLADTKQSGVIFAGG